MNHSHARTAVRMAGGAVAARREPVEDPRRRGVAHAVDDLADLGDRRGAAHQLAVGGAVGVDPGQERVERAGELLHRRQRRVGLGERGELGRLLLQRGREVGLLAREVVVEQRLRDPRLAGDPRHRQLVVGVAREQVRAELEQPPAALVDVEPRVGGARAPGRPYRRSGLPWTGERRRPPAPPRALGRRGAARGRDRGDPRRADRRPARCCGSRTSCARASRRSARSARRSRSSARPAPRARTRATSRRARSRAGSARRASRSSPAAARGSWRPPTAARATPACRRSGSASSSRTSRG